ncbi:MAG: DNA polymerase III subunit gamma/tau [Gammaproteobacteria bacterium]|nr:DNA polymerase III subunit gamma/tau [Gammaproteobacteria bacterium]
MSYQALARKWRPKVFEQVIGQEHVVSALVNGLDSQRVHHAFLFTGTRGVGKTTLARIFAKALNCEQGVSSKPCGECVACRGVDQGNFIDLIEVDAASRTKVDDTRELLDNVQYTPTQGRFKIYLIDEVHMLSTHSFNALLKTLEEPPAHVKFLLATTDPQKLPTTILSRCIQFNLKAMDTGRLAQLLEQIMEAEGVAGDSSALLILARSANGSVRDALSLLDQGIAFGNGEVREASIRAMLGMIDDEFTWQLLDQVCAGQAAEALETVAAMALRSADFAAALDEVLTALHNVSLYQVSPEAVEWKGVDAAALAKLAGSADAELLQLLYQIALIGKRDLPLAPDPRSGFEMVLLRMISFRPEAGAARESSAPGAGAGASAGRTPNTVAGQPKSAAVARKPAAAAAAEATPAAASDTVAEPAASDSVAEPAAAAAKIPIAQLAEDRHWNACVQRCGLSGLARLMMLNMLPESVAGDTLCMTLDADHAHLLQDERVKKIEQALAAQVTGPVKLKVTVQAAGGDETRETPSQREGRAREAQQQSAEEAFRSDPHVRELEAAFSGEVVSGSVRPAASNGAADVDAAAAVADVDAADAPVDAVAANAPTATAESPA